MGESYYEVLGVTPDASAEEIERAYRERVLETHPDRNDDPDAADQFKAVSTAADVLTDEAERAKYDRLGHEAYCGIESDSDSDRDGSPSSQEPHRSDEGWWEQFVSDDAPGDTAERSGPSHHARQRARRERRSNARARYWSGTETARGTNETDAPGSRSTSGAHGETADGTASDRFTGDVGPRHPSDAGRRTAGTDADTDQEFSGFAVHQWDEEVELASPFRRLDAQTLLFACGLALLYPFLVYTTITPHLPILVNVVIGACTVVLVGYLLTLPRIALASFGGWSLLVTGGLLIDGSIPAVSLVGLGLLAGVWIPFGYAVGVWIALRP